MLLMFSWQPFYLFFILCFSFWQCLACLVLKPKLGCRSAWLQIPSYTFVLLLIFNIPTQPLSERKKKKKKNLITFSSRLQAILSLYLESKNWWGLKIYFFSKNSFLSFNPLSEPNLRFLLTKKSESDQPCSSGPPVGLRVGRIWSVWSGHLARWTALVEYTHFYTFQNCT